MTNETNYFMATDRTSVFKTAVFKSHVISTNEKELVSTDELLTEVKKINQR